MKSLDPDYMSVSLPVRNDEKEWLAWARIANEKVCFSVTHQEYKKMQDLENLEIYREFDMTEMKQRATTRMWTAKDD